MLMALILICSLSTTPDIRDCSRDNAVDVLSTPENFGSAVTCFMKGQTYVAGTSLGRSLRKDEEVKVVCLNDRGATVGRTPLAH
jgi:hypothetical protein